MLRKIIPYFLKKQLQNARSKYLYKVQLSSGAHAHKVEFESNCSVGRNSEVFASKVGRSSYIGDDSKICYAHIGRYCAIGNSVRICLGNHPAEKIVSIHPCFYSLNAGATPSYLNKQIFDEHKYLEPEKKYVVRIGNDVWIGNNVSIMDGVEIADGAIIGAGSIVTHDIEPYAVVAGVPARQLKYRFTEEQIEILKKIKWWEKNEKWLIENAGYFSDIEKFMNYFS